MFIDMITDENLRAYWILVGLLVVSLIIAIRGVNFTSTNISEYRKLISSIKIGMTKDEMLAINSKYLSVSVDKNGTEVYVYQYLPFGTSSKLSTSIRKTVINIENDKVASFRVENVK